MYFREIQEDHQTASPLSLPPETSTSFYQAFVKRGLDVIFVLLLAPFMLPLVAVLAVLVRLDGGNAFYSQDRIGRSGRAFRFWKLRSMVPDAEVVLDRTLAENPALRRIWHTQQKLPDDPRITKLGRILRKSSLDELPQLWNVLTGDMSLVGPRPFLPKQQPLYLGTGYYRLRPGLTGLWQVSDRNRCTFAERAVFDDHYARRVTLLGDIFILIQTVLVVFKGTGS